MMFSSSSFSGGPGSQSVSTQSYIENGKRVTKTTKTTVDAQGRKKTEVEETTDDGRGNRTQNTYMLNGNGQPTQAISSGGQTK